MSDFVLPIYPAQQAIMKELRDVLSLVALKSQ